MAVKLKDIKSFESLLKYLRDELEWPIQSDDYEEITFEYTPEDLDIDPKAAVKVRRIRQLRPMANEPWGIFWVEFENDRLPIVIMRRILQALALKRRALARTAQQRQWATSDLLFISAFGPSKSREIAFAHFHAKKDDSSDLPVLRVLGWDDNDTELHLREADATLHAKLRWPEDTQDLDAWREQWGAAFTLGYRYSVQTAKELAVQLAKLAQRIRKRALKVMEVETRRGRLRSLHEAFQKTLIHDLTVEDFADTYAQTIAYGLLSARIADPQKKTADDFAAHMRTNPFLRELMETFLKVGGRRGKAGGPGIDFDELGVSEVIDLLDDANMEAVVRDFGDKNPQEDPVIHFYELFLKEYDAKKRMQRGVFYTPRPVVSYIVRSVDELLRTEFGLADGLADTTTWGEMLKRQTDLKLPEGVSPDQDFVQILDPATGTGTFLVEVIDLIYKTLVAKWKAQGQGEKRINELWNEYVPKHLLTRLHGYELLMAPYAIAHLKIGLKLHETGYRFESEVRARVYLTNALEPAQDFSSRLEFAIPALAHEATAVSEIKNQKRFTVVVGNPPYAGHSVNNGLWIEGLIDDYFRVDGKRLKEANSKWLRDDYVKFIRLSQYSMSRSGIGVTGLITNHGYLDNPTFRGMRFSLLSDYRYLWLTDLHGNLKKREKDEKGDQDENVFDIQQGVAILVAVLGPSLQSKVWHGHVRGDRQSKYAHIGQNTSSTIALRTTQPQAPFYLLVPQDIGTRSEYDGFLGIAQEAQQNSLGILTKRDSLAIGFTADELLGRLKRFAAPGRKVKDIAAEFNLPIEDKDTWSIANARTSLAQIQTRNVRPLLYRPFDIRFVYYDDTIVARTNRRVLRNLIEIPGNRAFVFGRQGMATGSERWDVCFVCAILIDQNIYRRGGGSVFPLYLAPDEHGLGLEDSRVNFTPNVAASFTDFNGTPEDIFNYIYAVFHSPGYRSRYAEFLKIDFPRLPLTGQLELFRALARLGGELTALHLLESPKLKKTMTSFIGGRNPEVDKVGWTADNGGTVWIDAEGPKNATRVGTVGFKGVPEQVWQFHIGGYQVCEKWLKDRKGRNLSKDDIEHYQKIVVALSETIRLMREIDEVIEKHGGWPRAFQPSQKE